MKNQKTIAIFVPVFNNKIYIEKCINSVLQQTYKDIHVYVFDDGSNDGTEQILDAFSAADERVTVKHGQHGQWIYEMDLFAHTATEDYIAFVDSDDLLATNHFADALNGMEENDCDAAIIGYLPFYKEEDITAYVERDKVPARYMSGRKAIESFLTTSDVEGFRWNKIFRKKVVAKTEFKYENTFAEDMLPGIKILANCRKVVVLSTKTYFYRQHETSLVAVLKAEKILQLLEQYRLTADYCRSLGFEAQADYFETSHKLYLQTHNWKRRHYFTKEDWHMVRKGLAWRNIWNKSIFQIIKTLATWERGSYKKLPMIVMMRLYYH